MLKEIIIDKMENLIKKPYKKNLIKENQSHKSIAYKSLRSLQGQDVGFHSFIALLNSHRLSSSFISSGISSQILGPRYLIFSVPLKTVRTGGM